MNDRPESNRPVDPPSQTHAARRRRLVWLGAALALVVLAFSGTLDRLGADYLDRSLQRALTSFALARTLNAAISVAQGTEVAVQPAGVGLVLSPGEILDPVNDLVERFSWVMLLASASLGIQKLLLLIGSHWGFAMILAALLAGLAGLAWRDRHAAGPVLASAGGRLLLALLVLRFAVPVLALGSQGLHLLLLEPEYREAEAGLESASARIGRLQSEALPAAPADDSGGLVEDARRWYRSALAGMDLGARLRAVEAAAAAAVESAVRLIALFLLETLVLPLAFLWLLVRLVGRFASGPRGPGRD